MTHKAVFLDRDGVINIDHGYVSRPEDFEFVEGIFDLCRHFQSQRYGLIIVTNQSGIARGLYTEQDFEALTRWMLDRFLEQGVEIARVYHCPHHPDFGPEDSRHCRCRKPEPGMIQDGLREFALDASQCIMIGDKPSDIEAARAAGITNTRLIDGDNPSVDLQTLLNSGKLPCNE